MTSRPLVSVQDVDGSTKDQVAIPLVFTKTPLRPDVVRTVHTNMRKNHRQANSVSQYAGVQTAARSWGTGRAVSRIPRVPGGGTHRCGQGAYGNMCRGGHMFSPTKVWRRWHRKINLKQKRLAVASALAASAVPSLVMARGHRVDDVAEIPLVVSDAAESITKTGKAVDMLKALGVYADVAKAAKSKNIRRGKGKMRNRRYVNRKGPLVIVSSSDNGLAKSVRNLTGVDYANVERLNLLDLAPGGHLGRLCIFTKGAIAKLDELYADGNTKFTLPENCMTNADLSRLINSDEVQSVVKAPKTGTKKHAMKKNPLKNFTTMKKLNPYAKTAKALAAKVKSTKTKGAAKDIGKKFYEQISADSDYQGEDFEVFSKWLGSE
mmetsp:Transcript_22353/g.46966  ORF Transcript_22353/g.46966 Transcript_22353/m.46966 type:complete len:378 (+) Transcript_22353:119-1252(+)